MSRTSAVCVTPAPTNAPVRVPASTVTLATLLVGLVGLVTTLVEGVLQGTALVVLPPAIKFLDINHFQLSKSDFCILFFIGFFLDVLVTVSSSLDALFFLFSLSFIFLRPPTNNVKVE